MATEADVLKALESVRDPDLHRDIVALGFVQRVTIKDGVVSFAIELTTPACPVRDQLRAEAARAVGRPRPTFMMTSGGACPTNKGRIIVAAAGILIYFL